jgi:hypothetical protein
MLQNKTNIVEKLRTMLIDTIVKHSSDELEFNDMVEISKESEEQLLERVVGILEWYKNGYDEV